MHEDTITVTLTDKADIDWVRKKVSKGHFASETDLIAEGISSLRKEDEELEVWIEDVVAERYDRLKANPESAIPIEQVIEHLAERRERRAASKQ